MGERRNTYNAFIGKPKKRDHVNDQGVDERTIL
jgi:hypothetical protein